MSSNDAERVKDFSNATQPKGGSSMLRSALNNLFKIGVLSTSHGAGKRFQGLHIRIKISVG